MCAAPADPCADMRRPLRPGLAVASCGDGLRGGVGDFGVSEPRVGVRDPGVCAPPALPEADTDR